MDHLPECEYEEGANYTKGVCICPELRACEQRVLDSADQFIKAHMEGKQVGYFLALSAARDAVAALEYDGDYCKVVHSCDALTAIDALRNSRV